MATEGLPATVTWRAVINWAEVGAIAGILALLQAPLLLAGVGVWRWARDIDRRLAVIEARSHRVRHSDAPEKPL